MVIWRCPVVHRSTIPADVVQNVVITARVFFLTDVMGLQINSHHSPCHTQRARLNHRNSSKYPKNTLRRPSLSCSSLVRHVQMVLRALEYAASVGPIGKPTAHILQEPRSHSWSSCHLACCSVQSSNKASAWEARSMKQPADVEPCKQKLAPPPRLPSLTLHNSLISIYSSCQL